VNLNLYPPLDRGAPRCFFAVKLRGSHNAAMGDVDLLRLRAADEAAEEEEEEEAADTYI
jgi:hypothetical protein